MFPAGAVRRRFSACKIRSKGIIAKVDAPLIFVGGSDVITAFYRMESLELWAKITINAVILGGSMDISRENIQKLIDLRGFYQVTGRHPGYKKFDNGLR